MITIYKYDVPGGGDFQLVLPANAKILTVQVQYGEPCIWAFADTEEKSEVRHFGLIGTGCHRELDSHKIKQYIGTFQMEGGALVFHLFELEI